jgi:hypothetical protein
MSRNRDWLPKKHELLYRMANMTATYISDTDNAKRMGLDSDAIVSWIDSDFSVNHAFFNSTFEAWYNPAQRTPAIIALLKNAESAFKPSYRKLYTGYLRENPLVTDSDLVNMGLPERPSGRHTSVPDPTTQVEATVDTSKPGMVIVNYRDMNSTGTAKPKGVHGAEMSWAVLDTPPVDWSELIHTTFDTRTPIALTFTGEQSGKHFYFAMRWVNTRGVKGPRSRIQSVIIP